ncbi:hypothetical protein ACFSQD_18110 [Flavihumibacter stibioxidans]|uniref:Uncharacterized protein n=1 Tax=Flavihumibacter stibioxidans TaxID=1834163 RepID=A0ABR7MCA0_9BACT|nr:hypothetical protein [Flavihumibacter stibioxidans]MBC6492661.1 hypothetical protein [Flavihumibacter stibioxidans]
MQPTEITQFDHALECFQQMDLVLLDLVLDELRTCQDMPRRKFMQMLGTAFRTFREKGNTWKFH